MTDNLHNEASPPQQTQLRKGILEFAILLVISRGEVYASDILTQLKDAGLLIVEGTLYPLLSRLRRDGYLEYRWEESQAGPPRKYYQLTESGKESLSSLEKAWKEISRSIAALQTSSKSKHHA